MQHYTEYVAAYPNYYALLGVDPTAPLSAIRRAYRARMLTSRKHPDLGGSTAEAALLNEAYAVLKDPERRTAYDRIYLTHVATMDAATTDSAHGAERRRTVRVAFAGHVQVRSGHPVQTFQGQCRDISPGGLSLRTLAALANDAPITVIFAEDPGMQVEGIVRWRRMIPQRFGHPIYEGGVEFSDLQLARFHEFCERTGLTLS